MTGSVIFAAPLLIAAIVMAVRFVGCRFQTEGIPPSPQSYSDTVTNQTPGLVSFWPLDEEASQTGTTNAKDHRDSNDGTYEGQVKFHGQGLVSTKSADTSNFAAGFDGATARVTVSPWRKNLNEFNSFSVEVLVEPSTIDPTKSRTIVSSFNDSDQTGYILALNNTAFEATVGTGAGKQTVTVPANAQANESHYVVMTYDSGGQRLELYVDPAAGQTDTTPPEFSHASFVSIAPPENYNATTQVVYSPQTMNETRIGASTGGAPPADFFDGIIQNVAVYDEVLAFPDIASHFWIFKTGLAVPPFGFPSAPPPPPPPPNKASYSDNFTRANAPDLGPNWTERTTAKLHIASNLCVPDTANTLALANYDSLPFTDNVKNTLTMGPTAGTEAAAIYIRSNGTDCIYAYCIQASPWVIYYKTGSDWAGSVVNPTQAAITSGPVSWAQNDTLSFEATGNVYTLKKNGTTQLSWTDSANAYNQVDPVHRAMAIGYVGATTDGIANWSGIDL